MMQACTESLPDGVSFPFQEPMQAAFRGLKKSDEGTNDEQATGRRHRRRGRRGRGRERQRHQQQASSQC